MPFKCRDKWNAYFKEFMRKGRAEKKRNRGDQTDSSRLNPHRDFGSNREQSKILETIAA